MIRCPVCGFPGLIEAPRAPSGGGSYEICPSCGFQFGVSDEDEGFTYDRWRMKWFAGGCRWSSVGVTPPPDWNPGDHLGAVGIEWGRACDSNVVIMAATTEHGLRQIRRIDERLLMFEDGRVSLRALIADIEFLLSAVEALDVSIREELRERWRWLEEAYSVALAPNEGKVDEILVRKTVHALRERIGELLTSPPQ